MASGSEVHQIHLLLLLLLLQSLHLQLYHHISMPNIFRKPQTYHYLVSLCCNFVFLFCFIQGMKIFEYVYLTFKCETYKEPMALS